MTMIVAALSAELKVNAQSSLPVVPGGYGFGMNTRAAYGGGTAPTTYRVTNLNDSGSGSLRAALQASGPRTVIFEVSGTIELWSAILIDSPYITIAGQTAPSPGITLKNYGLFVYTHDVLIQHIRIRPGGFDCNNGIEVWDSAAANLVFANISVSWGQDENVVFNNNGNGNMNATFWRSITSESLHQPAIDGCSGGSDDSHGMMVYDHTKNVSILQSLLASNVERNAYMKGDTTTYFANNVIYNFDHGTLLYDADRAGGVIQSSLIGNYYRMGPSTPWFDYMSAARFLASGSRVYRSDNVRDGGADGKTLFEWTTNDGVDPTVYQPPVTVSGYTPMSATSAYTSVIRNVGARPRDRDAVDARIINEVENNGGAFISDPSEAGGWPYLAMNRRTLTLPSNPHGDDDHDGYTNLEEWLHGYAAAVEGTSQSTQLTAPSGFSVRRVSN